MSISNISSYLIVFLCCYYPITIIIGTLRYLYIRYFCEVNVLHDYNRYTVYFSGKKDKQNNYNVKGNVYSFSIRNNNTLKRSFEEKEFSAIFNKRVYLASIYFGIIVIIGAVSYFKTGLKMLGFLESFIYVTIFAFLLVSTYYIITKPLEFYAKNIVYNYMNNKKETI